MKNFDYIRPASVPEAVAAGQVPGTAFLAAGTNLVDLMKGGVATPERVVDITRLPGLSAIERLPDGGTRVGALVRNSDLAYDPAFAKSYPMVAEALLAGASAQLRNAATVGGNLCLALPAGPMIALTVALDGTGLIWTPEGGERRLPVRDLVLGPQETALGPGEILRRIDLPAAADHGSRLPDRILRVPVAEAAGVTLDLGRQILGVHRAGPEPGEGEQKPPVGSVVVLVGEDAFTVRVAVVQDLPQVALHRLAVGVDRELELPAGGLACGRSGLPDGLPLGGLVSVLPALLGAVRQDF